MNDLLKDLENMRICGSMNESVLWKKCIELIEVTYVPEKLIGLERPLNEKDYEDYVNNLNKNLENIVYILQEILQHDDKDKLLINYGSINIILIHLIIIIGEQSSRNPWNTDETILIAQNVLFNVNKLFGVNNLNDLFKNDDILNNILLILRPKLLKDTWKAHPAAAISFKWILLNVEAPGLLKHLPNILPASLFIFDDFVSENKLIGLECLSKIVEHCSMQKEFIENGYALVIFDALKKLTFRRQVQFIIPLYQCINNILPNIEIGNNLTNSLEWSKRDDIIANLLDNMEMENDLELRHAYMTSLPQLLTNIGCAKWCERLIRILAEYCGHHTDLRTLRATLQVAETVLVLCHLRIPAHCTVLYNAFLKLHFDLTETPIFDNEIIRSLERCISILYKLTPTIGSTIIRDDRIKNNLHNFVYCGDTKYCN